MLRESASMSAIVCSAVLSVLPPGVFMTTMPCRVAASLSMLSVPTPARTIAFRRRLPSSASGVIFTPLRQIAPSNWPSASRSASPFSPVRTSYSMPGAAVSISKPSGASVSRTITRGMMLANLSVPLAEFSHKVSQLLDASYGHCIVDRRANAADRAVTLQICHCVLLCLLHEFGRKLVAWQSKRDIHHRSNGWLRVATVKAVALVDCIVEQLGLSSILAFHFGEAADIGDEPLGNKHQNVD